MSEANSPGRTVLVPLGVATIVYALYYGMSTTYGYDTAFRSLMGYHWLQHPFYIYATNEITWVFGPLHCYVNALAVAIFGDPNVGPRLFSTLFAVLSVVPFYRIARETFGARAAYYSSMLLPFYTVLANLAVSGNSEPMALFLLLWALSYVLIFAKSKRIYHALLAGISLTLAFATRYDIWLLLIPVGGYLLARYYQTRSKRLIRASVVFGMVALSFPLTWVIGNQIVVGDGLVFIHQVQKLSASAMAAMNTTHDLHQVVYNLAFLPGVLFLSLSPLVTFISTAGLYIELRRNLREFNLVLLVLATLIAYFLYAFVFTLQTILVSRLIVLHGVFLLIFFGAGLSRARARLRPKTFKALLTTTLITAVLSNGLIAFGGLSEDGPRARLRPISPVVQQPTYMSLAVDNLKLEADRDHSIMLDTKFHDQNILYLKLFDTWSSVITYDDQPEKFAAYVKHHQPDILVMSPSNGRMRRVIPKLSDNLNFVNDNADYILASKFDIFWIYRREDPGSKGLIEAN
jgi:4-amino-4-deoxy-L-arabinose transferase-like glycosyltransferase